MAPRPRGARSGSANAGSRGPWTEDGTVMALRHRDLPIEGVQFHPESIITETGMKIVQNWIGSL